MDIEQHSAFHIEFEGRSIILNRIFTEKWAPSSQL